MYGSRLCSRSSQELAPALSVAGIVRELHREAEERKGEIGKETEGEAGVKTLHPILRCLLPYGSKNPGVIELLYFIHCFVIIIAHENTFVNV